MSGWGKWLHYSGNCCPSCGRVRLELYDNGKERCEKCAWCPQENRYVEDDEIYPEEEDFYNA
jgi:hypothetical protein